MGQGAEVQSLQSVESGDVIEQAMLRRECMAERDEESKHENARECMGCKYPFVARVRDKHIDSN